MLCSQLLKLQFLSFFSFLLSELCKHTYIWFISVYLYVCEIRIQKRKPQSDGKFEEFNQQRQLNQDDELLLLFILLLLLFRLLRRLRRRGLWRAVVPPFFWPCDVAAATADADVAADVSACTKTCRACYVTVHNEAASRSERRRRRRRRRRWLRFVIWL